MRHDMAKIIVERPRRGAGRLRNRCKAFSEDLPRFLGVRRDAIRRGGEKHLNENLQPLWRYLERQVGRPWNKVYSEICGCCQSNANSSPVRRDSPKIEQCLPQD
jgi:hypothetical protein